MLRLDKPLPGLILAIILVMTGLLLSPIGHKGATLGLELLYNFRGSKPPPESVVIITLDSESSRALNVSERPDRWTRHYHARLIRGLKAHGARVIGFDMLFDQARDASGDQALAAALREAGNVVLVEKTTRDEVRSPNGEVLAVTDRLTPPLPLFKEAAWATAPFIMPKTPDGVMEFWENIPSLGDLPSVPAVMAHRMTHDDDSRPPIRHHGELQLLNLFGPIKTVRSIPYHEALRILENGTLAEDAVFRGKAVLVGFSEDNQSRQADMFKTPFSREDGVDISGVELCATALANLLEHNTLERPPELLNLALILLWSVGLALLWGLLPTLWAGVLTWALALAWLPVCLWAFSQHHLWLPVVYPSLITPVVVTALGLGLHTHLARRRAASLEQTLRLTPQGNARLIELLQSLGGGRTVHGICLCSDIESYTTLSENLSPDLTREVLNRYFSHFIRIVEAHGGHVMDMVGDSAMCLWLADESPQQACRQALAAALDLNTFMNSGTNRDAQPTRFGLHYGPVYLGELGTDGHREIRAVGDIVNTSSRIQSANKFLKTRVLASASVILPAAENRHRALGNFRLAGKQQPLELYEVRDNQLPAPCQNSFGGALQAYVHNELALARTGFEQVRSHLPGDGPTLFYLDRIESRHQGQHEADADGCVVMGSK